MESILELKTKGLIYQYILKHPGLHFRELVRELHIPKTTLSYHIRLLEKRNLIEGKNKDGYTRYYNANKIGTQEKKLLHIIRRETPRNILLYIFYYVGASQSQLSRDLEKHPTTIEFHLKRFLKMGIIEPAPIKENGFFIASNNFFVERLPVGNEIIYRLKDSVLVYHMILVFYNKKILDDNYTDAVFTIIKNIFPDNPKKRTTEDVVIERLEKMMFDIFPPFFIT